MQLSAGAAANEVEQLTPSVGGSKQGLKCHGTRDTDTQAVTAESGGRGAAVAGWPGAVLQQHSLSAHHGWPLA